MSEVKKVPQENPSPWDPVTKEHWIETWIWNTGTAFLILLLIIAAILLLVLFGRTIYGMITGE